MTLVNSIFLVHLLFFLKINVALRYNPSHIEIEDLTFHMRSQWRDVARCIVPVLTDFEIKEIELEEREDQPGRFLDAWINKHGLDAMRDALCAALLSVGLSAGAKDVFPEIYEKLTKVIYIFLIIWFLATFLRKYLWIRLIKFNKVSLITMNAAISLAADPALRCSKRR